MKTLNVRVAVEDSEVYDPMYLVCGAPVLHVHADAAEQADPAGEENMVPQFDGVCGPTDARRRYTPPTSFHHANRGPRTPIEFSGLGRLTVPRMTLGWRPMPTATMCLDRNAHSDRDLNLSPADFCRPLPVAPAGAAG